VPFGLFRFALARVSDGLLLAFGGTDGLTQTPYLSSYTLDVMGVCVAPAAATADGGSPVLAPQTGRLRRHHGRRKTVQHFAPILPQEPIKEAMEMEKAISSEELSVPRPPTVPSPPSVAPESPAAAAPASPVAAEPAPRPDGRHQAQTVDEKARKRPGPIARGIVRQGEQPSYAVQELLTDIGIDVSLLSPFETAAAMIKARRLTQMREQNQRLLAQVSRLEQVRAGVGGLPPGTPVLMKLCDEDARQTTIFRVNSDNAADEIRALATEAVGRSVVLAVRVSRARRDALTPDSLREAYGSICKQELTALIVIAM
jgi:ribosomal protein S18